MPVPAPAPAPAATDIRFHFGVEDRTLYVCRLLRKAARQGSRVLVRGEDPEMDLLDKALWTFDPQDFVPHHRLRPAQPVPPRLQRTALWLTGQDDAWPEGLRLPGVLVYLGSGPVEDAPQWKRVIEVVSQEEDDKRQARRRWQAYKARGWAVQGLTAEVAGLAT